MKKIIVLTLFAILQIISSSDAFSADLDVCPTCTYTTIQSAIDAAGDEDRIRVAQGTYSENLEISASSPKNITISGGWGSDFSARVNDPTWTVVDAGHNDRALHIYGGPSDLTIENITFQHGNSSHWGGCIFVNHPSGTINLDLRSVIVQDCESQFGGGGISFLISNSRLSANLVDVIVRRNHAALGGGGISVWGSSSGGNAEINIINSIIYSNKTEEGGGGLRVGAEMGGNTEVLIINSTITANTSNSQVHGGGGIAIAEPSPVESSAILEIYNTILSGNNANPGGDFTIDLYQTDSRADIFYSNVTSISHMRGTFNQGNNINTDPLFVNPSIDDFHLGPDSPLINAGTLSVPSQPGLPSTDFEGKVRVLGGVPDIGAYESEGSLVTPAEGTLGTEILVAGSGFGAKKGKILVDNASATVLQWVDGFIQCRLTKSLSPGSYDITIRPKGGSPVTYKDVFTVMSPVLEWVHPLSGSANDEITIRGSFFGTKKGKVTLRGKSCKVRSWTMKPTTGESEIRFVVPKGLGPGTYELKVKNGVGEDTESFTVD